MGLLGLKFQQLIYSSLIWTYHVQFLTVPYALFSSSFHFFIRHGNLVTNTINIDNKSKRGDEKAAWSWRTIYRGSLGLGHRRSTEGFSEPLTFSGHFPSREVRHRGQSLRWASCCSSYRWWGCWDGGRGHSKADHPKTLPSLISSRHPALTQRYILYLPAKRLCLHIYSSVPWNQIFVWGPMIYLIVIYLSLLFSPHSWNSNSPRVQ